MKIVNRLLNVGTLIATIALLLAIYGWARGYNDYRTKLSEQQSACEKQVKFDRQIAERDALPPDQRKPIFVPDVSYKYLCERKIQNQIFIYGQNDLGIGVVILLIVAMLNYVLFGKVTLWNRAPSLSKDS